jgi:cobalt/nickel transport protein
MDKHLLKQRNRIFVITGLGLALLTALLLTPFASKHPDGLDRVAQDLKFSNKAVKEAPASKLPFSTIFQEYSLKGVPQSLATPLAGLVGTLVTFGLAWGIGKVFIKKKEGTMSNDQ